MTITPVQFNFVDVFGKGARGRIQQGTAANRTTVTYRALEDFAIANLMSRASAETLLRGPTGILGAEPFEANWLSCHPMVTLALGAALAIGFASFLVLLSFGCNLLALEFCFCSVVRRRGRIMGAEIRAERTREAAPAGPTRGRPGTGRVMVIANGGLWWTRAAAARDTPIETPLIS